MENATIQEDEYTRRVDAEIQRLIQDDDWYKAYMRYQLYVEEEVARARKRAIKEGREEGRAEGEQHVNALLDTLGHALQDAGRQDELLKAVTDLDYRRKLLAEFGIA